MSERKRKRKRKVIKPPLNIIKKWCKKTKSSLTINWVKMYKIYVYVHM